MLMLLAFAAGCSFHARSPDEYRDATQALLDTKSADIKTCYDGALKGNHGADKTQDHHHAVRVRQLRCRDWRGEAEQQQARVEARKECHACRDEEDQPADHRLGVRGSRSRRQAPGSEKGCSALVSV